MKKSEPEPGQPMRRPSTGTRMSRASIICLAAAPASCVESAARASLSATTTTPMILPTGFVKRTTRATTPIPISIRLTPRFQPQPLHRGSACADADITHINFILIDCDAERDHPKGGKICTTDAEHEAALAKIRVVKQYLLEQGCPADAIIHNDSGNGGALLVRIDLPSVPASVNLVQRSARAGTEV